MSAGPDRPSASAAGAAQAAALIPEYEAIVFEAHHAPQMHLPPASPSRALDLGAAGTVAGCRITAAWCGLVGQLVGSASFTAMRFLATLSIACHLASPALAQPLQIGDAEYPPACARKEWRQVEVRLNALAGDHEAPALARLARAYLCGQGEGVTKQLLRSSPRRVLSEFVGTGQDDERGMMAREDAIEPQAGRAWGVQVRGVSPKIELTFFANEACVRSVTFKPSKAGWLVVSIGQACD